MLTIPFIDDFSGEKGMFPNDSLWANKYVYINSYYAYMPPSIGVATFDELNDSGKIYSNAITTGFIADSLTSNPIRLDSVFGSSPSAIKIGDSLYFSFFYQPQGIGDTVFTGNPQTNDSLVLEFYSPDSMKWKHVWADTGSTLHQFYSRYSVWFKQVMIPITDSIDYFHPGFRFRFYNWASIANTNTADWPNGTGSIWNLDYVYLNKGRTKVDTVYSDIAFVYNAPSMLMNYYAMPWSQYKVDTTAEMKDSLNMTIRNLDTTTYNSSYKYSVQENGDTLYKYNGGSANINSLSIQTYKPHARPPVNFHFPVNSNDSAEFLITHVIKEGILGDNLRSNDTTIFDQKFYDYYAYDNGVPEAGYLLSSDDYAPYGYLAYQFKMNHPDTLRAIEMFFPQALNLGPQFFNIAVWNDASGYPGDTLYEIQNVQPIYVDSLNEYVRYRIDNRIVLLSGTFYVGWEQPNDEDITVGFDLTNNEDSRIFYNVGSGWSNSILPGALMIRPVFGKVLPPVADINEKHLSPNEIKVYPNPSSGDNIFIDVPALKGQDISQYSIHLFDLIGNEVYSSPYKNNINISGLQNGMYLLCVYSNDNSKKYFTKLTVVK